MNISRQDLVATDAHAAKDFRAFARRTGNEILSDSETDSVFEFFFKRKQRKGQA